MLRSVEITPFSIDSPNRSKTWHNPSSSRKSLGKHRQLGGDGVTDNILPSWIAQFNPICPQDSTNGGSKQFTRITPKSDWRWKPFFAELLRGAVRSWWKFKLIYSDGLEKGLHCEKVWRKKSLSWTGLEPRTVDLTSNPVKSQLFFFGGSNPTSLSIQVW